ncbi:MAG TPA: RagB/SusD family nutrient uptake outer membrane protein [Chitinophagaceae bacterium]|nr:RagB/SusD family nutrient uptake outer membrane protein [Chitinophagaceae bacterium]
MKTIFLYRSITAAIVTALVVVGVSSCKKYLDVQPVSSATPDYVFSNFDNAYKAVLGTYASLTGDQGYGIRISMYYPYDNDEMMGQSGAFGDNERRDIAHYNAAPGNTQLYNPYSQLYQGIERANLCIYYIPQMDLYTNGTDEEKKQLKRLHGEALTLRAQYYFELIRNWGDVVAQWQPSGFETDLFKAKTDRDTIYDRLLSDLATAETLVPWWSEVTKDERITQGAVRGLRARIALYRAGWSLRSDGNLKQGSNPAQYYQIVKDECNSIIASSHHSLNSSFQSVFKDNICGHTIEPNGEVVWEVAMAGGNSGLGDSKLGYYNGPRYNNTGNSALVILPTFFYLFDSTDLRRDVTIAPYFINQNYTLAGRALSSVPDGKFRRDWTANPALVNTAAQYMGMNWPLIRYSDVLLMLAEADNELNNGPTTAAYNAVNMVRRRGYGKPITIPDATVDLPAGLSETAFFDAIVKERSLELASEGHRKYDLIRWNLLAQKLAETKTQLAAMAARQAPYDVLPLNMYYKTGQTTMQWAGSFYQNIVTTTPTGYTAVAWVGTGITTGIITNQFAAKFESGKSELLPFPTKEIESNRNLVQNPKY